MIITGDIIGTLYNISGYNSIRLNYSLKSGFIPAISFYGTAGSFYIETRNQSYPDFFCSNNGLKTSKCENSFQRLNLNENWKLLLAISTSYKNKLLLDSIHTCFYPTRVFWFNKVYLNNINSFIHYWTY